MQAIDHLDHLINRHSVTEHSGNQFGIIPIFGIELVAQPLDGGLVSSFVDKLEIIAFVSAVVHRIDDVSAGYGLGQEQSVFVIGQPGEDFVRPSIDKPHKSDPFFFVVLKPDNVGFQ